jgi:hypothetical protein
MTVTAHRCVACPTYRPDDKPRIPTRPLVCDGDRRLLDGHLAEIPDLHARLADQEPAEPDLRTYVVDHPRFGERTYLAEPLSAVGGAGPVPGASSQPRVSGSRGSPAPTSLERIDLALPARPQTRALFARGVLGLDDDQTGSLSTATILDTWARDWRDRLWPDQHLPSPTVPEMVRWLRNRVDEVCDRHPAVDEFAAEVKDLRHVLRRQLGETAAQPETERYRGVACQKCDLRGVLMRRPGSEYVECGACGLLLTEDELADWTARLAGYERSMRPPEEVAEALRGVPTRRPAA